MVTHQAVELVGLYAHHSNETVGGASKDGRLVHFEYRFHGLRVARKAVARSVPLAPVVDKKGTLAGPNYNLASLFDDTDREQLFIQLLFCVPKHRPLPQIESCEAAIAGSGEENPRVYSRVAETVRDVVLEDVEGHRKLLLPYIPNLHSAGIIATNDGCFIDDVTTAHWVPVSRVVSPNQAPDAVTSTQISELSLYPENNTSPEDENRKARQEFVLRL
eukprot:CAMPEP_0185753216 /NCGR_PEP_ID=MMETSP1174-20130828/11941_1 /TAXON_ID=35687 /ORGANISM="Dictyocha speculum, Strain CCMP1381" /LENGTH=217 /DNA_ID=CAMNT_0028430951 /DNA_START=367 /DNA_END=1021 /DNA_ORIENTATION=-